MHPQAGGAIGLTHVPAWQGALLEHLLGLLIPVASALV